MNSADACLLRVVKLRVVVSLLLKVLHPLRCLRAQIIESAEHDRFGWTDFRACGHESAFLSIVAECALECATGIRQRRRAAIDHSEWTRDDAIAASITDIILHKDGAGFSA